MSSGCGDGKMFNGRYSAGGISITSQSTHDLRLRYMHIVVRSVHKHHNISGGRTRNCVLRQRTLDPRPPLKKVNRTPALGRFAGKDEKLRRHLSILSQHPFELLVSFTSWPRHAG